MSRFAGLSKAIPGGTTTTCASVISASTTGINSHQAQPSRDFSTKSSKRTKVPIPGIPKPGSLADTAHEVLAQTPGAARNVIENLATKGDPIISAISDNKLRDQVLAVETAASRIDTLKSKKIESIINDESLNANQRIHALIKLKAPSNVILNLMHKWMTRSSPAVVSGVNGLDILGGSREWLEEEFTPSGYDMEDSSDPDTLPQMRSFTKEEMAKLLQDVEASKYCVTDVEDQLLLPANLLGVLHDELTAERVRFGLEELYGKRPDLARSTSILYDITKDVELEDLGELETQGLQGEFEQQADDMLRARTHLGSQRAPVPLSFASTKDVTVDDLGSVPANLDASATGGDVAGAGMSESDKEVTRRMLQQHNASVIQLRGHEKYSSMYTNPDDVFSREAAKRAPKGGAHTLDSVGLADRQPQRDPRLLHQANGVAGAEEVENALESLAAMDPENEQLDTRADELRGALRKLTRNEMAKFVQDAATMDKETFDAKLVALTQAMETAADVVEDTEKHMVFGEADVEKVASKYGQREQVAQTKASLSAPLTEFDDDDGRYDLDDNYTGPRQVNTPGMTPDKAEEMLHDVMNEDAWASYFEGKLPSEYYDPIVLNGRVGEGYEGSAIQDEQQYTEPSKENPMAVAILQRMHLKLHSRIISAKKLRRFLPGIKLYSSLPPQLLNALVTPRRTYWDTTMALHPDVIKSATGTYLERLKKLSKGRTVEPMVRADDLVARNDEVRLKKLLSEVDHTDDDMDLKNPILTTSQKMHAFRDKLLQAAGLTKAEPLQPHMRWLDEPLNDWGVADEGTEMETDYDTMIMNAQNRLADQEADELEEPITKEDQILLNTPSEQFKNLAQSFEMTQVRDREAADAAAQKAAENGESADPDAPIPTAYAVTEFVRSLKADQAVSLRKIYALDPFRARELVASAMAKPRTPGSVAESKAIEISKDEIGEEIKDEEDEDEEEAEKKRKAKEMEKPLDHPDVSVDFVSELAKLEERLYQEYAYLTIAESQNSPFRHVGLTQDDDEDYEDAFHANGLPNDGASGKLSPTLKEAVREAGVSVFRMADFAPSAATGFEYKFRREASAKRKAIEEDDAEDERRTNLVLEAHETAYQQAVAKLEADETLEHEPSHYARVAGFAKALEVGVALHDTPRFGRYFDEFKKTNPIRAQEYEDQFGAVPLEPLTGDQEGFVDTRSYIEKYLQRKATKGEGVLVDGKFLVNQKDSEGKPLDPKFYGTDEYEQELLGREKDSDAARAARSEALNNSKPFRIHDRASLLGLLGLEDKTSFERRQELRHFRRYENDILSDYRDALQELAMIVEDNDDNEIPQIDLEKQIYEDPDSTLDKDIVTGRYTPRLEETLTTQLTQGEATVLTERHLAMHDQLFFRGFLQGDDYAAAMANNKEHQLQLGLESSDAEMREIRAYRREFLMESAEVRREKEEEIAELADDHVVLREPHMNHKFDFLGDDETSMVRRVEPYTEMPYDFTFIPPLIGVEQQSNLYHLHLLDPATFHPRWIAKRLNITHAEVIGFLKGMDFQYKFFALGNKYREVDESLNPNDLRNPNPGPLDDFQALAPPETMLSSEDPEYYYAAEGANMIGKVSWDDSIYKDPAWKGQSWTDNVFLPDGAADGFTVYQQSLKRRWLSHEQRQDAVEKANYARFGPVSWASGRNAFHRPPKLPREVISSTLLPPSRHNWVLTNTSEKKKNTFAISVRDKDGYLRHPTYREFKTVRFREKDARLPFNWRKYQVLGKVPEISSVFIDQMYELRASVPVAARVFRNRQKDDPFDFNDEQVTPDGEAKEKAGGVTEEAAIEQPQQ